MFKSDDKYLYDLNVRVKSNPNPGQYEYMVKNEFCYYIQNVLVRSYYRHEATEVSDEETLIVTNCEPDAFKMVFERAFMDKHYEETGSFALTANEVEDSALANAILEMSGNRNAYTLYNQIDEYTMEG